MTFIPVTPGIGFTIYGSLPRDIERARAVIATSDIVTLHTAADVADVANAAAVRKINPNAKVWLAIPANYLSGLDLVRGRPAALAEVKRCATIARDAGVELFEINGEGASDGTRLGDWTSKAGDAVESARLESLGLALLGAIRSVFLGAVGWTSHDGTSFAIPRQLLGLVDLHSQQHYPALTQKRDEPPPPLIGQRGMEKRVSWSQGQWEGLVVRGKAPADVAPHGARWSMYTQAHGIELGALVWALCEAATARVWAFPSSWASRAFTALVCAQRIRTSTGFGPGAIERWQAAHGLSPDGTVGPLTIASLERS